VVIDISSPLKPNWFTRDFNDGLTFIGLPPGGETGARIARRLAVSVNPDTLVT
jgi:hypothetical protein